MLYAALCVTLAGSVATTDLRNQAFLAGTDEFGSSLKESSKKKKRVIGTKKGIRSSKARGATKVSKSTAVAASGDGGDQGGLHQDAEDYGDEINNLFAEPSNKRSHSEDDEDDEDDEELGGPEAIKARNEGEDVKDDEEGDDEEGDDEEGDDEDGDEGTVVEGKDGTGPLHNVDDDADSEIARIVESKEWKELHVLFEDLTAKDQKEANTECKTQKDKKAKCVKDKLTGVKLGNAMLEKMREMVDDISVFKEPIVKKVTLEAHVTSLVNSVAELKTKKEEFSTLRRDYEVRKRSLALLQTANKKVKMTNKRGWMSRRFGKVLIDNRRFQAQTLNEKLLQEKLGANEKLKALQGEIYKQSIEIVAQATAVADLADKKFFGTKLKVE